MIPALLLRNRSFVKTRRFEKPVYLGDPINIVRIFNDKEADEVVVLDITATVENKRPQLGLIEQLASECFMPVAYGGGVRDVDTARAILAIGVEKVCVNTHALERPAFIRELADVCGSQSVVVSLDVRHTWRGYRVCTRAGSRKLGLDPVAAAVQAEQMGAGEILLTAVDRDGTMSGYDIPLVRAVTSAVSIPVIACGGAASTADFSTAVRDGGAAAVAAGAMFVFHGPHRAVLINTPSAEALDVAFAAAPVT